MRRAQCQAPSLSAADPWRLFLTVVTEALMLAVADTLPEAVSEALADCK
jgi:hypothetical protein